MAEAKKKAPTKKDEVPEVVIDNKPEVTIDKGAAVSQEEINSTDKMVKVATSRDHKCVVGGETYYFTKGKQVSVPFNVKSILKQAGVLAAL